MHLPQPSKHKILITAMMAHEQKNEGTYLPRSVTGCRSQGLIRSTSPVSHLETPQIVNISIEHILSPGASCPKGG